VQTKQKKLDQTLTGDDILASIGFQKRAAAVPVSGCLTAIPSWITRIFSHTRCTADQLKKQDPLPCMMHRRAIRLIVESSGSAGAARRCVEMPIEGKPLPRFKGPRTTVPAQDRAFCDGLEIQIPSIWKPAKVLRINTESGRIHVTEPEPSWQPRCQALAKPGFCSQTGNSSMSISTS